MARPNLVRIYDPDFRELTEGEETVLHTHPEAVNPPTKQVLLHVPGGNIAAGVTRYLSFPLTTWNADETDSQMYLPYGGHVTGLLVCNSNIPATAEPVVTVRIHGASSPVTVTIPVGAPLKAVYSDMVHSVPFQSGKLLSVQVVNNDSATWALRYLLVMVEWD